MALITRVKPSYIGTAAACDADQLAAAAANRLQVNDLIYLADVNALARVTSATNPGTTAQILSSAGTAVLPVGAAVDDVLLVGAGPAIARSADLGFDIAAACARMPRAALKVLNAGNLTPAGTPVTWQPSVAAALVKGTFSAAVTLNAPTTALPGGTFSDGAGRTASCRLQLTNTHASRPQRIVRGTIPVIGEMPDLVARAGRSVLIDLQNDGDGWAIVGRNAVSPSIEFAAGFNGEAVPQLPNVILEQAAVREMFVPADFGFLGRADCWRQSGAAFRISLRRLVGSTWQNLLHLDFPANGIVGVPSLGSAFPDGATIFATDTFGIIMEVPAGAANVTNLRGSIPVLT
jgi:hypothetical protein